MVDRSQEPGVKTKAQYSCGRQPRCNRHQPEQSCYNCYVLLYRRRSKPSTKTASPTHETPVDPPNAAPLRIDMRPHPPILRSGPASAELISENRADHRESAPALSFVTPSPYKHL